jgi:hypothetical protein
MSVSGSIDPLQSLGPDLLGRIIAESGEVRAAGRASRAWLRVTDDETFC